jgi:hypothetical protein
MDVNHGGPAAELLRQRWSRGRDLTQWRAARAPPPSAPPAQGSGQALERRRALLLPQLLRRRRCAGEIRRSGGRQAWALKRRIGATSLGPMSLGGGLVLKRASMEIELPAMEARSEAPSLAQSSWLAPPVPDPALQGDAPSSGRTASSIRGARQGRDDDDGRGGSISDASPPQLPALVLISGGPHLRSSVADETRPAAVPAWCPWLPSLLSPASQRLPPPLSLPPTAGPAGWFGAPSDVACPVRPPNAPGMASEAPNGMV